MNINITLEKWIEFYQKNKRFYDGSYINKKKVYSQKEIEQRYNKFIERYNKRIKKEEQKRQEKYEEQYLAYIEKLIERMESDEPIVDDPEWQELLERVKERDDNRCRLISILTKEEKEILYQNAPSFLLIRLEGAHCISRARSKNLYYEKNNIYMVNCYSHRNLDEYRCPLTGNPITKEEVKNWWIRIVGKETFEWLEKNK